MNKKVVVKLLIIIISSILIFTLIYRGISGFGIYKENNFDKNISVEIKHPDGSCEYFDSINFPLVNRGDIIYATVNLPKEKYIQNATICFNVYYSVIYVYDSNNNLIYEYGKEIAEQGKMIGGIYTYTDIPEESWGKSLTIKLEVQENDAYSKLNHFAVMKSSDSYKYLLMHKEVELFIFLAILVISLLITLVLLFEGTWSSIKRQGIFLSSFFVLICLWYLEFNGMLNLFINNKELIGNIEFVALFLSPVMLTLFFFEHTKNILAKKIQLFLVFMFGIFDLVCIILNHYTREFHYCRMLLPFHLLLLVGIFAEIVIIVKSDMQNELSSEIMKYGGVLSLSIMVIELIRNNMYKYMNCRVSILSQSFTSISIIIFIISILLSFVVKTASYYVSQVEKRNLEKLAYYDGLTGIFNRAGCYKYFENLDRNEENAIIFVDVNNLKHANDVFGHEMGDKLIKCVGEALRTTFKNDGFCGRFGGDEFIAEISSDKVDEHMSNFNKILYYINKDEIFPFEVSVSYGISVSDVNNTKSIDELIREADEKMYEQKKKNKNNR